MPTSVNPHYVTKYGLKAARLIAGNTETSANVGGTETESQPLTPGVGDLLHKRVSDAGFDITKECNCKSIMDTLNQRGPFWAERNVDTVISYMVKEARVRGIRHPEMVLRAQARHWIEGAIRDFFHSHDDTRIWEIFGE